MTADDVSDWLATCKGSKIDLDPLTLFRNVHAAKPPTGANGAFECYNPITVNLVGAGPPALPVLRIEGCAPGDAQGVYLADHVNQCTTVSDPATHGVVISGRYSACTFAKCTAGGLTYFGHVFVASTLKGKSKSDPSAKEENFPTTQARAFETACGATPNTATGFKTKGRIGGLLSKAAVGFVFATFTGGDWHYHLLQVGAGNPATVLKVGKIDDDFVAL